ncbi:condensation domain-containing protein, partial [Streptomyces hainanensis]
PPVQQELPPALRLPVEFESLPSPDLVADRVADERARRFEPWAWPLLRLRVLTTAPEEHTLLVHAHHLIGDGYSAALLGRELLASYDRFADQAGHADQAEPPPPRATFRQYVTLLEHQDPGRAPFRAPFRDPVADAWRARHDAPYQRPEPGPGGGGFGSAGVTLDAGLTGRLRRLAATVGATTYAPVLTAYYRALAALTGRRDLVLGLAVTGRDHRLPDIDRLFGPLATAVPLRPAV